MNVVIFFHSQIKVQQGRKKAVCSVEQYINENLLFLEVLLFVDCSDHEVYRK